MGPTELLRWQWQEYPKAHRVRANLVLHLCSWPLFLAGTVLLLAALLTLSGLPAVLGLGGILVTLVAQGRGHKLEAVVPAPFTSPWNFLARLFLEQWITFPRYLVTGGWGRAWRGDAP